MSRNPSLLLRVTRALVGLVTVWCLGCAGYEPIVDSLHNGVASRGMDCGASSMNAAPINTVALTASQAAGPSISESPTERSSADCGCGGWCYAVSINYAAVVIPTLSAVELLVHLPVTPVSVSRAPLLPPPQRAV